MKFTFFGSSEFSVYVLDELKLHNFVPDLIITTPDKPKDRRLVLTPTPTKVWAHQNNVKVAAPPSLKNNPDLISKLETLNSELFLVASYGKIIPQNIFNIPGRKTLNIHPSLLPKYRGASPIQSQILNDEKNVGVTIMQIEEEMDAGPIIVQKKVMVEKWPIGRKELEKVLAIEGARLFTHILPEWLAGVIDPIMQNENNATYCTKITKKDGLVGLDEDPRKNLLKIKAYEEWPTAYFLLEDKRGIITEANITEGKLQIKKVIPEGKREMPYEDFLRGQKR